MTAVTVIKRNFFREETWRYTGRVLELKPDQILLEAHFNGASEDFHGICLKTGDRFIETFYTRRWYNIFEMHDRDDQGLKGWYCNIGYPAEISGLAQEALLTVSYVDLALDLLVYPNGDQLVLDEDEFEALQLSADLHRQVLAAMAELQAAFRAGQFSGDGQLRQQ